MQFSRDGDWRQVIRIAGPSHNLLALKMGKLGASGPNVERISVGKEAPVSDADDVRRQVLEGATEANAQLGTDQVTAIRFVTTDTPSSTIYRSLVKVIVELSAKEGMFA